MARGSLHLSMFVQGDHLYDERDVCNIRVLVADDHRVESNVVEVDHRRMLGNGMCNRPVALDGTVALRANDAEPASIGAMAERQSRGAHVFTMHLNTRFSAHLMLRVGPRGSMQQCLPERGRRQGIRHCPFVSRHGPQARRRRTRSPRHVVPRRGVDATDNDLSHSGRRTTPQSAPSTSSHRVELRPHRQPADLHSRVSWSQEPQVSCGRGYLHGQLALNTLNRVFRDIHVIRLGAASRRGPDDTGRYIDDTLLWPHGERCRDRW
jgi:hypothetical protein